MNRSATSGALYCWTALRCYDHLRHSRMRSRTGASRTRDLSSHESRESDYCKLGIPPLQPLNDDHVPVLCI